MIYYIIGGTIIVIIFINVMKILVNAFSPKTIKFKRKRKRKHSKQLEYKDTKSDYIESIWNEIDK